MFKERVRGRRAQGNRLVAGILRRSTSLHDQQIRQLSVWQQRSAAPRREYRARGATRGRTRANETEQAAFLRCEMSLLALSDRPASRYCGRNWGKSRHGWTRPKTSFMTLSVRWRRDFVAMQHVKGAAIWSSISRRRSLLLHVAGTFQRGAS